jgi:hypothetical protein
MHGLVHVHAFRSRLRAPDGDGLRRCRAVQSELLDGELEAALAALADSDELIVVRRVQSQVRLNAQRSDRANARAWSDSLATALARALHHAPARDLLRFARRRSALQAFVHDSVAGETTRDWAWQRLGLLPAGSAPTPRQRHDALLRLLADDARDADAGVPLLRALLATRAWPLLVERLADGELRGLAQSVLLRLAGHDAAAFDDAAALTHEVVAQAATAGLPRTVQAGAVAAGTPARHAWTLRLGAMLADPLLARRGARAVDVRLGLRPATAPRVAAPAHKPRAPGADASKAALAQSVMPGSPADTGTASAPAAEPDSAWTAYGGLLFLLPLLPACGVLPGLEDEALWPPATGGLRGALHSLALHLQAMDACDPTALAFCGLPPTAKPPAGHLTLTAAQQMQLGAARDALLDSLAGRLPAWRGPALLARVVQRGARIEVVPGWIEASFSLRDVSTELRRAALDLDPGFIPWLGAVLRFRYE